MRKYNIILVDFSIFPLHVAIFKVKYPHNTINIEIIKPMYFFLLQVIVDDSRYLTHKIIGLFMNHYIIYLVGFWDEYPQEQFKLELKYILIRSFLQHL